jgi:D-alanyl-D-alanine carboxypeptidase
MRWVCALLMLALMQMPLPVYAQPSVATLQQLLDDFVRDQKLPGAVLAVSGPRIDTVVASGVLDRKTGAPVTSTSRFYVASTGKMTVAAAVLELVDEGRIRLDQRISEIIVPAGTLEGIANWSKVTVEQLLNHSSGMPDYFDDAWEEAAVKDPRMLVDVERALVPIAGQPADFAPGTAYAYSNTNFALLGLILQRVDGGSTPATLGAVLAKRIFVPAGMTLSSVGANPKAPDVASGHSTKRGPQALENLIAYGALLGDGPLTTTAGDLVRFLNMLLVTKKFLKPETLNRMLEPSPREEAYGLGIEIAETDYGMAYGHNGSVTGFKADAWYYSQYGTSIVFLTNGEYRTDDADIVASVAELLFDGVK